MHWAELAASRGEEDARKLCMAMTRAGQRLVIVSAVELPQEVEGLFAAQSGVAGRYRKDARAAIRSVVIGPRRPGNGGKRVDNGW